MAYLQHATETQLDAGAKLKPAGQLLEATKESPMPEPSGCHPEAGSSGDPPKPAGTAMFFLQQQMDNLQGMLGAIQGVVFEKKWRPRTEEEKLKGNCIHSNGRIPAALYEPQTAVPALQLPEAARSPPAAPSAASTALSAASAASSARSIASTASQWSDHNGASAQLLHYGYGVTGAAQHVPTSHRRR